MPFKQTWQGSVLLRLLGSAADAGAERRAEVIRGRLRQELHRVSGQMADESFCEVSRRDNKVVLSAGSDAPHTIYHELGTSRFVGHPQIRAIMDSETPKIGADIAAEVGARIGGAVGRVLGRR